ncbi:hypothetical protein A1O7_03161 [Cladophialophora yegresii CBS 114405]|uniref:Mso1 N-terminal domain-containing protein n=1 Tax=Cladophialophora yegresii CBS 114405 TaxID=1182544 RepID=W9W437_9EURO|nr:uncharacterized protein A1O7_03161 [Cladophialophora yegresii CBS 114405]EXJ62723.1 hypothetical protein A1O7_03161 [Cladophialophora yegresii CBS 114405]
MASYLSYFTSNSSSQPAAQNTTAAAASTWSSTFSSRIATLRKALTKDSEEDDPDNEDCSHISNVLRAYYTEKGRPFPEWLPPDPKRPVTAPLQPQGPYGQYGNQFPSQSGNQQTHSRGSSGSRAGGLSDLWDSAPAATTAPPQSLRAARTTPNFMRSNDSARSHSSGNGGTTSFGQPIPSARPLPSQRAGSYQTAPAANPGAMGSRDRLRARLQGGGSGRSSPSSGLNSASQGSYGPGVGDLANNPSRTGSSQPYISASEPWSTGGDPYAYDSGGGGGSRGGSGSSNPYATQDHRQRPGGPR